MRYKWFIKRPHSSENHAENIGIGRRISDGIGRRISDGIGRRISDGVGRRISDGTGRRISDGVKEMPWFLELLIEVMLLMLKCKR